MIDPKQDELEALRLRVELLERDNQRLREKLDPFLGPDNPCFDPRVFARALQRYIVMAMIPLWVLGLLLPLAMLPNMPFRSMFSGVRVGPLPLLDLAGSGSGIPGIGLGIIAFGGFSFGAVAVGGGAIGLIALGGGAAGVIAVGGGSVGLIALGGGAVGYIALGGSACGYYALGQRAYGKFAFGMNRQDPEAVEFFVRYLPRLRNAVTAPMPVIVPDPHAETVE
jgi:hypothetical protein